MKKASTSRISVYVENLWSFLEWSIKQRFLTLYMKLEPDLGGFKE
jgi:hypothetical protein